MKTFEVQLTTHIESDTEEDAIKQFMAIIRPNKNIWITDCVVDAIELEPEETKTNKRKETK